MSLGLGKESDERHGFDGETPGDAHDWWETGLMSIIDLGEKSQRMSLDFEYISHQRFKLSGEVSK